MIMKTFTVVVVVLMCVGGVAGQSVGTGYLTASEKTLIVDAHNSERGSHGSSNMYKLSWDEDLESEAQSLANQCLWEHTADADRSWGENMAMIMFSKPEQFSRFPTSMKIDIVVTKGMGSFKSWIREKEYDVNHDFSCATASASNTCGHYTQVVWHSTTKVGCAAKNCLTFTNNPATSSTIKNVWILVCDYREAGNTVGEPAFNNGTACSECSSGDSCDDTGKLCVAS